MRENQDSHKTVEARSVPGLSQVPEPVYLTITLCLGA